MLQYAHETKYVWLDDFHFYGPEMVPITGISVTLVVLAVTQVFYLEMDDDIGSFFSELKELEAVNYDGTEGQEGQEQPSNKSQKVGHHGEAAPSQVAAVGAAVISRSAEITIKTSYDPSRYTTDSIYAPTAATMPSYASAAAPPPPPPAVPRQNKTFARTGGGDVWVDNSLNEWPENDYRIFVGDLAKEVNTEHLQAHFQHYKSFAKAKVIRTKHESKARGFGFVSFLDPMDCAKAIREQNGKYLASRPMKITKSNWDDRDLGQVG
jgi:hypothetical protein